MTTTPSRHLTTDELDAFHSGSSSADAKLHLETCDACRSLTESDRDLVLRLGQLPPLRPRAGFEDRVIARIAMREPVAVPVLSYPKLTRRRVAVLSTLAAGITISAAWSAVNRSLLDAWLASAGSVLLEAGTATARVLLTLAAEQPWYESLRQAATAPSRIAFVSVAVLVVFAAGLAALRRLLSPSAATVFRAGA
jgi:hypothetical protein